MTPGPTESLTAQLSDDIGRWLPELEHNMRSTLWHGVFLKAAQDFESLTEACLQRALSLAGDGAKAAIEEVGGTKPVEAFTVGQQVKVLFILDRQEAIADERLLTKAQRKRIEELVRLRNEFIHGRLPFEEGPKTTKRFLQLAREHCESPFIHSMKELDV